MLITPEEKKKMLTVPLCSRRLVASLERIGVAKLSDLKGKEAKDLMKQVNEAFGHLEFQGPLIEMAMTNLIRAAEEN